MPQQSDGKGLDLWMRQDKFHDVQNLQEFLTPAHCILDHPIEAEVEGKLFERCLRYDLLSL